MGRSPAMFVRPVTMTEGQHLQRIGRTARHPVKRRRAVVVVRLAVVDDRAVRRRGRGRARAGRWPRSGI